MSLKSEDKMFLYYTSVVKKKKSLNQLVQHLFYETVLGGHLGCHCEQEDHLQTNQTD